MRRSPGSVTDAASAPVPVPADGTDEPLLTRLSRDYPDLSGRAVAEVLERAWTTVWRSNSCEPDDVAGLVTTVARDQLDLARERLQAATSRTGVPHQRRESGGFTAN